LERDLIVRNEKKELRIGWGEEKYAGFGWKKTGFLRKIAGKSLFLLHFIYLEIIN